MKYIVTIPEPSAKRMVIGTKTITIETSDGWVAYKPKIVNIPAEQKTFTFEMPDDIEWRGKSNSIDAAVFDVKVTYSTANSKRTETIDLMPEIV